jgi:putative MFS transporter
MNAGESSRLSVQGHIDLLGWTRTTSLMFVACGLYWLCDAIELGLMSYLIPILEKEWNLSRSASSSIASIVFGGMSLFKWAFEC